MSFAPYAACLKNIVKGCFNSSSNAFFEYAALEENEFIPFPGYETKIYVGPIEGEFRYAKVTASRAYVVIDEDATGAPVVEKWAIKSHRKYTR